MAIKINWYDMYRRVRNWQDVQRVILNWDQIRPTEIPHVIYHTDGVFTSWTMPSWWGWNWVFPTEEWVSVWPWHESGTISYNTQGGMPSLAYARKIKIIVNYWWTCESVGRYNTALGIALLDWTSNKSYTSLTETSTSWRQYITWIDSTSGVIYPASKILEWETSWVYTSTIIINMDDYNNPFAEINTTWPDGFTNEVYINMPNAIWFTTWIMMCNNFQIALRAGITLKRVDFYVYNRTQ